MKKTWHTIFLILLICLDAALLLLPLLPGYRALFDIGPYPGRPPAFRFLKLAGYALFFPLTAYGCGRLLARIRKPRLRWLPAAVFALIATALVCLQIIRAGRRPRARPRCGRTPAPASRP